MTRPIRTVAVLGAGVMGAGIAAHVANAGLPVLLLDIVPTDLPADDRSRRTARDRVATAALAGLLKSKPAALFSAGGARLISIGNLEDDLERAASCDLVIEAIIERLDIKRTLFERLDRVRAADTIIASNTSGLRIADLVTGRSDAFRRHFLVTHFFNPPRYMKLLELVTGETTDPDVVTRAARFGKEILGKGIVFAKDRPNFIANRIGAHSMMTAIHQMLEHKLAPEDLDAITGLAMGHPRSATFRTGDVVGLDTLAHVVDNCHAVLTDDEDRDVFALPTYIRGMLQNKQLGDKTRGGFYRKGKAGLETLDPYTGSYRPHGGNPEIKARIKSLEAIPDLGERLRTLVATEGVVGEVAWNILSRSLAYAARRVGEISDDIEAIDNGMKWGYSWELGPFQTWDALGFATTFDRMIKEGIALPPAIDAMRKANVASFYSEGKVRDLAAGSWRERAVDPREISLEVMRRGGAPVLANAGAEAWDLGDGVLGVTFKTKANSIDADVINMLGDAVARAETDFRALLVANQGEHFCVGANLFLVGVAAGQKNWPLLREMIGNLQAAAQRMKYSTIPVVVAPYGMTLGGGLELCLAADAVQPAAETYAGPVEVGVGLIPGGAGNLNLLWRALEGIPTGTDPDIYPFVTQVFKNIALARVGTSAREAAELGYFAPRTGATFDRARQLSEAKALALSLANAGYHPPAPRAYRLPGESGIATLQMLINTLVAAGHATEYDGVIAHKLATVLCGGIAGAAHDVTEDEILELEREAFVSLCGEPRTQARMQHMLMHNKPLRN